MKPTLRNRTLILVFCLFAKPIVSTAQLTEQWVSRYAGPYQQENKSVVVKTDVENNVYVTGFISYVNEIAVLASSIITIKYDAAGKELWSRTYEHALKPVNRPTDLTLDASGNVYVLGYVAKEQNAVATWDMLIIKYDTEGNQLLAKIYNGPGNGSDAGSNIIVDESGNMYITGASDGLGTAGDFMVFKYDAAGSLLWENRYDGPESYNDGGASIAVDKQGNVYALGASFIENSLVRLVTRKYSSAGAVQWTKTYSAKNNWYVSATALQLDGLDNVLITGQSQTDSMLSALTIKYSNTGNEVWRRFYNPPGKYFAQPVGIFVDKSDNVIIGGRSNPRSSDNLNRDFFVVKYAANGTQAWSQIYNSGKNTGDYAEAMTIDSVGNIAIVGYSNGFSSGNTDFLTVQYDPQGNLVSALPYKGLASSSRDGATAVTTDFNGNVIVTGFSNSDFATLKYTPGADVPLILEAEQATRYRVDMFNIHRGYTGSGFADFINKTDDFVEWSVRRLTTGVSNISIRYANDSKMDRPLQLSVNGTLLDTLSFIPTNGWTNWSYVNTKVKLNSGNNTIRLTATGASGPNIDHLLRTDTVSVGGILEAEHAKLINARIAYNHNGFTGVGFADIINYTRDNIEWTFDNATAGPSKLDFRYALKGYNSRPMQLEVNGVIINPAFAFPGTGGWEEWGYVSVTTQLKEGENKIKLTAIGSAGPNLDHLKWSFDNNIASKVEANKVLPLEATVNKSIVIVPNPASDVARLIAKTDPALPVTIKIFTAAGMVYKQMQMSAMADGGLSFSVSGWPQGFYTVVMQQGSTLQQVKLVIRHY